jgi:hypothetical protein
MRGWLVGHWCEKKKKRVEKGITGDIVLHASIRQVAGMDAMLRSPQNNDLIPTPRLGKATELKQFQSQGQQGSGSSSHERGIINK